jgi:CRISPR-associated protein Cas6
VLTVELRFPVTGTYLASDHDYAMFKAISQVIPEAHGAAWLAINCMPSPVPPDGAICISPQAQLRMRLPQSRVPLMLKLSGRRMKIGGQRVRFCPPKIFLLKPSANLYARCVTIKNRFTASSFLDAVALKLDEMGIEGQLELGLRQCFHIGRQVMVGFALRVHDLSEDNSITLQEQGLGNRRHIGCGFFVPVQDAGQVGRTGKPLLSIPKDNLYAR